MSYFNDLKNRIFSDKPEQTVRAVVYARVSTDNEGQKDSCANQLDAAMRFISQHPNIRLVDTYVDDGISGKNEDNRPAYRLMIRAIEDGNVDLVIAKTTSRLNRSRYDAIALETLLQEHQATIFTLEDSRLQDLEDLNEAIVRSVDSTFNERYSKDQSDHGHDTQRRRIAKKELSAKDISCGYRWNPATKTISVNENEAAVIRFIFEEYVFHGRTPAEIQRELSARGIDKAPATIVHYLQDERYIGRFYINKKTSRFGAGKQHTKIIHVPKDEWVLVERQDLRILDDDVFDLAQRIRKSRQDTHETDQFYKGRTQAHYIGTHEFARKIICAECKKPYQFCHADREQMIPIYRIHNHKECRSPQNRVYEKDVEDITKKALRKTLEDQEDILRGVEDVLIECLKASKTDGNAKEIERLRRQKSSRQKQLDKLIEQLSTGIFNGPAMEQIQDKVNGISAEIQSLEMDIQAKEANRIDGNGIEKRVEQIRKAIQELKGFRTINREQVLNYVDRIEVHVNGDLDIYLQSGSTVTVRKKDKKNSDPSDGDGTGRGKTFNGPTMDPCQRDMPTVQKI